MMYGLRLDAGQPAEHPRQARPEQHGPSHNDHRRSKPVSNRSNVIGPGAMKNTKIQIGQCLKPVADLVALADPAIAGQLDARGVTVLTFVRRGK